MQYNRARLSFVILMIFFNVFFIHCDEDTCVKGSENLPRIQIRAILVRCPKRNDFDTYKSSGDSVKRNISDMRSDDILQFHGFDKDELLLHSEVTDCKRKLVITVKLNNCGRTLTEEEFIVVDHVYDPIIHKRSRLLNPLVIKLKQEQVTQMYGLVFLHMINSEAREEVYNKNLHNFTGCDTTSSKPTCGLSYIKDKAIPFSEGFCCSCDSYVNMKRQPLNNFKYHSNIGFSPLAVGLKEDKKIEMKRSVKDEHNINDKNILKEISQLNNENISKIPEVEIENLKNEAFLARGLWGPLVYSSYYKAKAYRVRRSKAIRNLTIYDELLATNYINNDAESNLTSDGSYYNDSVGMNEITLMKENNENGFNKEIPTDDNKLNSLSKPLQSNFDAADYSSEKDYNLGFSDDKANFRGEEIRPWLLESNVKFSDLAKKFKVKDRMPKNISFYLDRPIGIELRHYKNPPLEIARGFVRSDFKNSDRQAPCPWSIVIPDHPIQPFCFRRKQDCHKYLHILSNLLKQGVDLEDDLQLSPEDLIYSCKEPRKGTRFIKSVIRRAKRKLRDKNIRVGHQFRTARYKRYLNRFNHYRCRRENRRGEPVRRNSIRSIVMYDNNPKGLTYNSENTQYVLDIIWSNNIENLTGTNISVADNKNNLMNLINDKPNSLLNINYNRQNNNYSKSESKQFENNFSNNNNEIEILWVNSNDFQNPLTFYNDIYESDYSNESQFKHKDRIERIIRNALEKTISENDFNMLVNNFNSSDSDVSNFLKYEEKCNRSAGDFFKNQCTDCRSDIKLDGDNYAAQKYNFNMKDLLNDTIYNENFIMNKHLLFDTEYHPDKFKRENEEDNFENISRVIYSNENLQDSNNLDNEKINENKIPFYKTSDSAIDSQDENTKQVISRNKNVFNYVLDNTEFWENVSKLNSLTGDSVTKYNHFFKPIHPNNYVNISYEDRKSNKNNFKKSNKSYEFDVFINKNLEIPDYEVETHNSNLSCDNLLKDDFNEKISNNNINNNYYNFEDVSFSKYNKSNENCSDSGNKNYNKININSNYYENDNKNEINLDNTKNFSFINNENRMKNLYNYISNTELLKNSSTNSSENSEIFFPKESNTSSSINNLIHSNIAKYYDLKYNHYFNSTPGSNKSQEYEIDHPTINLKHKKLMKFNHEVFQTRDDIMNLLSTGSYSFTIRPNSFNKKSFFVVKVNISELKDLENSNVYTKNYKAKNNLHTLYNNNSNKILNDRLSKHEKHVEAVRVKPKNIVQLNFKVKSKSKNIPAKETFSDKKKQKPQGKTPTVNNVKHNIIKNKLQSTSISSDKKKTHKVQKENVMKAKELLVNDTVVSSIILPINLTNQKGVRGKLLFIPDDKDEVLNEKKTIKTYDAFGNIIIKNITKRIVSNTYNFSENDYVNQSADHNFTDEISNLNNTSGFNNSVAKEDVLKSNDDLNTTADLKEIKKPRKKHKYIKRKIVKRQILSNGVQYRGGQSCIDRSVPPFADPVTYHESAHCLRFSDLWYNVYKLKKPFIQHSVHVQLYEKHNYPDGRTHWQELSKGVSGNIGTFVRHAADELPTISFNYIPFSSQNSGPFCLDTNKAVLLTPQPVPPEKISAFPQAEGGPKEYLLINPDEVSLDGEECDKAGVGFEAFARQPDRCARPRGTCLKNQPIEMWKHDRQAKQTGVPGKYFLENFASIPDNPFKLNLSSHEEYLALDYSGRFTSAIEIEVRSDLNAIVRSGISGQLTEIYVDATCDFHTRIMIVVTNIGLISSAYFPRLSSCPVEIPDVWTHNEGPLINIAPQHRHVFRMSLYGKLPVDRFHCSVDLLNEKRELVSTRRVRVQRYDRCLCLWHCLCACIGSLKGLDCEPMSTEHYHAAGFQGSLPVITTTAFTEGSKLWHFYNFIFIYFSTTLNILLLGFMKAMLGLCCCSSIGSWGMWLIFPRKAKELCEYMEPQFAESEVQRDPAGYAVDPENGSRNVRILGKCGEFCTNLLFFAAAPIAIVIRLLQICCPCLFALCITKEKEVVEVDEDEFSEIEGEDEDSRRERLKKLLKKKLMGDQARTESDSSYSFPSDLEIEGDEEDTAFVEKEREASQKSLLEEKNERSVSGEKEVEPTSRKASTSDNEVGEKRVSSVIPVDENYSNDSAVAGFKYSDTDAVMKEPEPDDKKRESDAEPIREESESDSRKESGFSKFETEDIDARKRGGADTVDDGINYLLDFFKEPALDRGRRHKENLSELEKEMAEHLVDTLQEAYIVYRNLKSVIGGVKLPLGVSYCIRGLFVKSDNGYRFMLSQTPFLQYWNENNQAIVPPLTLERKAFEITYATAEDVLFANELSLLPRGIVINVWHSLE